MEKNDRAIFNLQRFQILQTKLNPSTSHLIPDAYAYAWYQMLYPLLDDSELHEDLADLFKITKVQVDLISTWADSEWLENRYHSFYDYEDHFNVRMEGQNGISRHVLLATFRYLFLHGTFDDKFWDTLNNSGAHPTEAGSITSKFSVDYIYLV